jgi:hypothetical protein
MKNTALKIGMTLALGVLSGCSSITPDFADMSQTYQTVLEKYQNNNLLLNIIRSSRNMPMSFLEIPSIVGTGNISETAGLGAFLYGVAPGSAGGIFSAAANSSTNYYNPSVTLSLGRSFNFTQSSLENSQFQKGFISNITLETMTAFTKDHISSELLYTMVIDRFEVTSPEGKKIIAYNNPSSATYDDFQKQLRGLIDAGLTTEIVAVSKPIGPALSAKEISNPLLMNYVTSKDKALVNLDEVNTNGVKSYQFRELASVARFCFNTEEYKKVVIEKFGPNMLCGNFNVKNADSKIYSTANKNASIQIQLRSTRDVFDFLGQIAKIQLEKPGKYVMVRGRRQMENGSFESFEEYPMVIIEGNSKEKAIAIINYDGSTYSIPDRKETYSSLTFNLLSQFFNLTKVPGSVPPSPAVLIK